MEGLQTDNCGISERDLERIKKLRLMDDEFFRVCFKDDKEGIEFILRIILDKKDLVVTDMRTQHSIKNLQGHSVILDVFATDSEKRFYNIEVQRDARGAKPERARYISGMIDVNLLHSAEDYNLLPRTYVIFITENDVLGEGRLIYHIYRVIAESGNIFDDKSHIIYVNASYKDDSALGLLMHDFNCSDPDDMNYQELRQRTIPFKTELKEAKKMSAIWEEVRQEGIDIGKEMAAKELAEAKAEADKARKEAEKARAEAKAKAEAEAESKHRATKTALRMIKRGNLSTEEIAEYTGLSEDEIKEYTELIAG